MPLEGVAKRISEITILDMPIGDAALGGATSLIIAELTDALVIVRLPTVPVVAIKGAEAFLMSKYGHKLIGTQGARMGALFLTWEAIRALVPIDTWISNLISSIAGGSSSSSHSSSGYEIENPGGNGHHASDGMSLMRDALTTGGGS